MDTTVGETTPPPLMFSGRDMAAHLVGRNAVLIDLLVQLKFYTEYGVNLNGVRDMVTDADGYIRTAEEYNKANMLDQHHVLQPKFPGEAVMMFCRMSPSERGRLRLIATLAGDTGVEFSVDDIAAFADVDPGLVADYAAVLVARFAGI